MSDNADEVLNALIGEHWAGVAPSIERKEAMRSKLLQRVRASAAPLGSFTIRAKDEGDWIQFSPKIQFKKLSYDEQSGVLSALWRMQPGAVFPAHEHSYDEECLVLQGSIRFGDHPVYAGDFHFIHSGHQHPPIHSDTGALVYIRSRLEVGARF